MKLVAAGVGLLAVLTSVAAADTLYDLTTFGNDVIPSVGIGHLLGGACIANTDVAAAHITSPAVSAFADKVVVTVGVVHNVTNSSYTQQALASLGTAYQYEDGEGEARSLTSATTLFPSATVIIPLHVVNLFSGYFVEKIGRATLAAEGTAYADTTFHGRYEKESSVFSVPLFLSAAYKRRLALSGGLIFSYLDSREKRSVDFVSEAHEDITDVVDMYAAGTSWALGALLDYDFIRVGASFRTGSNMSGHEELSNEVADIWKSGDIDIAAPGCFKVGASIVTKPLTIEVDYETSQWSRLKLGDGYLSVNDIYRYSLGVSYTGTGLWNAAEYPLLLGYYRQPLDQRTEEAPESTEDGYLAGTTIAIAQGRAKVAVGLEYITRKTAGMPELHEEAFGFYLSIAVQEAWRRPMKH